jgi:hypothetical protein
LDVVTSTELNRNGLPDLQQLRLAASDRRCLVTANRDDYINLTTQLLEAGEPHAGVLIVPSSWTTAGFSRIAQALKAYAERHGDAPTTYLLDFLR